MAKTPFKDYAKKLKKLGEDVPAIFEKAAKLGANHFVTTAKENTDKKKAVDTGAYKRSWDAEVVKSDDDKYSIKCVNTIEYASFLEDGYKVKKAHFVPFKKMEGSPKSQKIVAEFKAKYPNAKGFIAKPRRFKGLKIGRLTVKNTRKWILDLLAKKIDKIMKQK